MTFTATGSMIQSATNDNFSLTPAGAGDLIVAVVLNVDNATVNCTSLASSNVTWTLAASGAGTVRSATAAVFTGRVTAASAATVTLTWDGTPPGTRIAGWEFTTTAGAWRLDTSGLLDSAGTDTWPSLTPAGTGELYFGFAYDTGSASAGATSGYTYDATGSGNGVAFNPAVSAASGPVWGDAGSVFGLMVLIEEAAAGLLMATFP